MGRTTARAGLRVSIAFDQVDVQVGRLPQDRLLTDIITMHDPGWLNWFRRCGTKVCQKGVEAEKRDPSMRGKVEA